MSVFTKDTGRILGKKEVQTMTGTYRDRKLEVGLAEDEYVRSEYFGMNQVMHLLNQPGCVGIRVHYAKRWEDADGNPTDQGNGQLIPRVLLTGVDAHGRDMPVATDNAGAKDMPGGGGGGGGGGAVGDGWTCPKQCGGAS